MFTPIVLPGALGTDIGDNVAKSMRLRASASAYLSRTFGTPTSQNIFSLSTWRKRGTLGVAQNWFGASTNHSIGFNSSDQIALTINGTTYTSTAVFRDPSAHYHILYTQSGTTYTVSVNNVSVLTGTSVANTSFNTAIAHQFGAANTSNYSDGVFSDVCFVDGTALTPSSFGRTSVDTGAWVHKDPTGITWGTNGFRLRFNSISAAADFGTDSSGNGNTFTVTNVSATAGVTYDSLTDTPTNNYPTWNPLDNGASAIVYSDGNLRINYASAAHVSTRSTMAFPSSGKYYVEAVVDSTTSGSSALSFGIADPVTGAVGANGGTFTSVWSMYASSAAFIYTNGAQSAGNATFTAGDILQLAVNVDTGKIWVGKNNTWWDSAGGATGSPSAGTNQTFTKSGSGMLIWGDCYANGMYINAGQRPFTYTPPTGYLALCTANLPTPALGATAATQAGKHFAVNLRTGTAATYSVTGIPFQPDLVWVKSRGRAVDHSLYDAVRGVQKQLISNTTGAETTQATGLTAFNSDGYTGGALDQINGTTATNSFVDWMWKANGAGSSNTAGSITSTVSANTAAGFSIAKWTGTAANGTVGHGLGVAPKLIIFKANTQVTEWPVYHGSLANTEYLVLNTTAAKTTAATTYFNSTSPTTTVFSVGSSTNTNNTNGMLAYCFAEIDGYSKIGSYTGNGSTDGPFVWCGFRPRWVLIKRTDAASDWYVWDTARDTYNVVSNQLLPNSSAAESAATAIDVNSSGFKCRSSTVVNVSTGTYIFYAVPETPFKYATAR